MGWEPIQQLASLQAESLDTDTHGGRCLVMTEAEKGAGCRRTGDAEDCWPPAEALRGEEGLSASTFGRENRGPFRHTDLGLLPSRALKE